MIWMLSMLVLSLLLLLLVLLLLLLLCQNTSKFLEFFDVNAELVYQNLFTQSDELVSPNLIH